MKRNAPGTPVGITILLLLAAAALPSAARCGEPAPAAAAAGAEAQAAGREAQVLGKGAGESELVAISELTANPAGYVGRTIRVEGLVKDVCPMAGCWIDLAGDRAGTQVHVKVDDGVIVFPKDARGKRATVEGVFTRIERTPEEALASARHFAEEKGQKFDPSKAELVTVTYQIMGTGAVIR